MRLRRVVHGLGLVLALLGGCDGCAGCGGEHLAELTSHEGGVLRDHDETREQWVNAEDGATFDEGDGLQTGPDASARVRVVGAGEVQLKAETLIRFFASQREGQEGAPAGVEVESGQAVIDAVEAEMPLRTSTGVAVVGRGSRVRVDPGERGMRYSVELGSATFVSPQGEAIEVEEGESIEVGIGLAEITEGSIENIPPERAEAEAVEAPDAGPAPGGAAAIVKGPVRSRGEQGQDWESLREGEREVAAGTELDVGEGGEVDLRRGKQRAVLGAGRYTVGEAGDTLVRAEEGTLTLSADGHDARLRVPGGVIIVRGADGGSSADVRINGEDGVTELSARRGKVDTEGPAGEFTLGAGEEATLRPPEAGGEGVAGGGAQGWSPGLPRADFSVSAGESFQVFDPGPPSAIAFSSGGRCEHGSELRLGKTRLRAAERASEVIAKVPAGLASSYQLYCLREDGVVRAKPAARGRVRVVRSNGTRKLATNAPHNTVNLDGRRYTLMYQGRLPRVTVVWPRAPKASAYTLYLTEPGGKKRQFDAAKAQLRLPTSAVSEGTHRAYILGKGTGGKRSKETTFTVHFDNAAPTASVSAPPPSGFAGGGGIEVSGTALQGTHVSVDGKKIALDAKHRFSATVPAPADGSALALRFQHRKHGVRYYLRRKSGAGQ